MTENPNEILFESPNTKKERRAIRQLIDLSRSPGLNKAEIKCNNDIVS